MFLVGETECFKSATLECGLRWAAKEPEVCWGKSAMNLGADTIHDRTR